MISIAAETGWSESYILEELPLARAQQYTGAIMARAGVELRFVKSGDELEENEAEFLKMTLPMTDSLD